MPKNANFNSMAGSDEDTEGTPARALVPAATDDLVPSADVSVRTYSSSLEFEDEDTMIPRLRLAQALTPEVVNGQAESGQWVLVGAEPADTVVVVPLSWNKSREYRLKDENEILCSSPDAKFGHGEYGIGSDQNPTGRCSEETCPAAQWTENKRTGKNNKPLCSLIYSYVVWDVTHGSLVAINFQSTSLQAAKLVNTMVKSAGGWGKIAVQLGAQQQKGQKGTFFIPTVAVAKVDESVIATAQAMLGGQ